MSRSNYRSIVRACDDLVIQAAEVVGAYNKAELDEFAEQLNGLGGLTYHEMLDRLEGVKVPGDFRHFRLTNLNLDCSWGASYSQFLQPVELCDIVRMIDITNEMAEGEVTSEGAGTWVKTVALPIVDPGVLELGLLFESLS